MVGITPQGGSRPRLTYLSRAIIICLSIAFIGGASFLFTEPNRWNHPSPVTHLQHEELLLNGRMFRFELTCTCPSVVTQGETVELPFLLKITPLNPRTDYLAKPASTTLLADAGGTPVALMSPLRVVTPSTPHEWVYLSIPDPTILNHGVEEVVSVTVQLQGITDGLSRIDFSINREDNSPVAPAVASFSWPMSHRQPFGLFILPYIYAVLVFGIGLGLFLAWSYRLRVLRERTERNLADAQKQAADNPEVAKFAWDLARVKLEAYFDRNLIQVNLVFWVASGVMAIGFCFVLLGVWLSYSNPSNVQPPRVAAISGVITQFIGATFMVIYRSIMAQANGFMNILERINTVGMAVQVLDSLKDGTELKDLTRAQIVTLLLANNHSPSTKEKPRQTK
jgi:hypothetical protein